MDNRTDEIQKNESEETICSTCARLKHGDCFGEKSLRACLSYRSPDGNDDGSAAERMTCRNQRGQFRLMPNVNIMDAIEKLGMMEEAKHGKLVIAVRILRPGDGSKCRDCMHYKGPQVGSGICMVHPAQNVHRKLVGPNRPVAAARPACPEFEPGEDRTSV